MPSSYGEQGQGQVAFTEASQSAVPLSGGEGGPDSAASTPDSSSNERRELAQLPPQQGESKEGIPRHEEEQEEGPSEIRQPKVAVGCSLCCRVPGTASS